MRTLLPALVFAGSLLGCQRSTAPPAAAPAPEAPSAPAVAAPSAAPTAQDQIDPQPERATGCRTTVAPVHSPHAMVVAAHPEAVRIGTEVLDAGGTAVDAAAAVAVALTLVEPQSSGIGGGAFLLHYDAQTKKITAWDGRETAPAGATPELFMGDDGPRSRAEVVPSGSSVGTPGLVRMLADIHSEHGRLPWGALLQPTIALAEKGFVVTPRLNALITMVERWSDPLRQNPAAHAYFYRDGRPVQPGQLLRNPELADTLRLLAERGPEAFYEGPIAEDIVRAVQQSNRHPGTLSLADLRSYRSVRREPVCLDYRGHTVCGHPPPTSGGVTVLQILGLLESFDMSAFEPGSAAAVHLFAEAVRLAWADRERYLGDPGFVAVPTEAMLDEGYLRRRAKLIDPTMRASEVEPGKLKIPRAPKRTRCPEGNDTSHVVVVDAAGDVVTMTSSVESGFGSGIFVGGFLLNNELTDFSFKPKGPGGKRLANAVEGCKRPLSSMAPIVVLDADRNVELALGSPGGTRIIQYVARTLVEVLDHGLDLQQAISRPNVVARPDRLELENDCGVPAWAPDTIGGLEALGHAVEPGSLNSGLHGIQRVGDGWIGGVDPRREGEARAPQSSSPPAAMPQNAGG